MGRWGNASEREMAAVCGQILSRALPCIERAEMWSKRDWNDANVRKRFRANHGMALAFMGALDVLRPGCRYVNIEPRMEALRLFAHGKDDEERATKEQHRQKKRERMKAELGPARHYLSDEDIDAHLDAKFMGSSLLGDDDEVAKARGKRR